MPCYRILRLKAGLRPQFRQLPHVSGATRVKLKDYEEGDAATINAATPYAAWFQLKDGSASLQVGDILVDETGDPRIVKFVGFEPVEWIVPEAKLPVEGVLAGAPA